MRFGEWTGLESGLVWYCRSELVLVVYRRTDRRSSVGYVDFWY